MTVETKTRPPFERVEIYSKSLEFSPQTLRTFPKDLYPLVFTVELQAVDDAERNIYSRPNDDIRYVEEAWKKGVIPYSSLEFRWDGDEQMFLPSSDIRILTNDSGPREVAEAIRKGNFRPNLIVYTGSFWNGSAFATFLNTELDSKLKQYHVKSAWLNLESHGDIQNNRQDWRSEAYIHLSHHPSLGYLGEQTILHVGASGLDKDKQEKIKDWLAQVRKLA